MIHLSRFMLVRPTIEPRLRHFFPCSCSCVSHYGSRSSEAAKSPKDQQMPDAESKTQTTDTFNLNFLEMQSFRRTQAHQSVLIQAVSREYAGLVQQECEKHGPVKAMFHYRQHDKDYFLVELNSQEDARKLVENCGHPAREDIVPVRSRLLDGSQIRGGKGKAASKLESDLFIPREKLEAELRATNGISQQMEVFYTRCRLPELGTRLRFFIASQLEDAVSGLFPANRVYLFGSSVNGFGQYQSDVDMILDFDVHLSDKRRTGSSLALVAKQTAGNDRVQIQRSLELLADNLQYLLPGYSQVQRILLARVPIVKFFHDVSGVRCDLSITNMSGLVMSHYLYSLGQMDKRLRILVMTIRRWAEANRLTSAHPGRWITNFTLTILVVFFMQHKSFLPPLSQLSSKTNPQPPPHPSSDLKQMLTEFFTFYSSFDYKNDAISVIDGTIYAKPDFSSLYIENPVDTELNICRNLSGEELDRVVKAMKGAVWVLHESGEKGDSEGILRLFKEFGGKEAKGVSSSTLSGFNVGDLFEREKPLDEAGRKYRPDEFVVEATTKRKFGEFGGKAESLAQSPSVRNRGRGLGDKGIYGNKW